MRRLLPFPEAPIAPPAPRFRRAEDRKSTRLNSSHGYISYAVFCLKKKTKHRAARSVVQLERIPGARQFHLRKSERRVVGTRSHAHPAVRLRQSLPVDDVLDRSLRS